LQQQNGSQMVLVIKEYGAVLPIILGGLLVPKLRIVLYHWSVIILM